MEHIDNAVGIDGPVDLDRECFADEFVDDVEHLEVHWYNTDRLMHRLGRITRRLRFHPLRTNATRSEAAHQ